MTRFQMTASSLLVMAIGIGWASLRAADPKQSTSDILTLTARSRTDDGKTPLGTATETPRTWKASETAIIVCDMWDNHWCQSAARRVGEMVPAMNRTLQAARARGVTIIHAPSDVTSFYEGTPQRTRMKQALQAASASPPPVPIGRWCALDPSREPPLPIDDRDGGCDDPMPGPSKIVWTRQHPGLEIADVDGISDRGDEVYQYLRQKGITNVAVMGVHTNMCVLGRSFAIRQLVKLGFNVVLVRDLTDAMYDPRDRPMVSHADGTGLVIAHIERYWCPSILADDLTRTASP